MPCRAGPGRAGRAAGLLPRLGCAAPGRSVRAPAPLHLRAEPGGGEAPGRLRSEAGLPPPDVASRARRQSRARPGPALRPRPRLPPGPAPPAARPPRVPPGGPGSPRAGSAAAAPPLPEPRALGVAPGPAGGGAPGKGVEGRREARPERRGPGALGPEPPTFPGRGGGNAEGEAEFSAALPGRRAENSLTGRQQPGEALSAPLTEESGGSEGIFSCSPCFGVSFSGQNAVLEPGLCASASRVSACLPQN